jgi:hypothetical protein
MARTVNEAAYIARRNAILDNPLALVDPSGACDVLINGVNQRPGWLPIDTFASQMINVFPYADNGLVAGTLSVFGSNPGTQTAYNGIEAALTQTPPGQTVNVFSFSGGAQSLDSAFKLLSPGEQTRIGNITYMIPGSNDARLPSGTGSTSVIFAWDYPVIPSGRPSGSYTSYFAYNSFHDLAAIISEFQSLLNSMRGSPCSNPQVVVGLWNASPCGLRGGRAVSAGPFSWWPDDRDWRDLRGEDF